MKKILVLTILFVINFIPVHSYNFPITNPYSATIIGSSTLMTPGVSEKIPRKEYEVKIKENVPEIFWYAKNFKFSLTARKGKAPLIFILAGTGSDYKSIRMRYMERILYDAGFSVITISSPMSSQFLISASKSGVPGLLMEDNKDIYTAMKKSYETVKDKIEVEDFYLMGYSLGATNSAIVSYIDETEKYFKFKRVFMLNPAVDLYGSALKLDNYLDNFTGGKAAKVELLLESVLNKMKKNMKNEYQNIDIETIYKVISGDYLSDIEKKAFIGLAFRISSIDLNFISDVLTKSYIYTDKNEKLDRYTSLFKNFERVNFANFRNYIERIGYPYYKKQDVRFTIEKLNKEANLRIVDEYIRNTDKIVAVTNEDELILTKEDLEYLKDVFKNRIIVYPNGGHCGNMFYYENVKIMTKFLKEGVLENEK